MKDIIDKLSANGDGTWLQTPIYIVPKATGEVEGHFYKLKRRTGKPDRRTCLWPPINSTDPEFALIHFDRIFGVSSETIEAWEKTHSGKFTHSQMDVDYIYDADKMRDPAGKSMNYMRRELNKFKGDGGRVIPYHADLKAECLKVFDEWKAGWKERNTHFTDQISSATYLKACLNYSFHEYEGVNIDCAVDKDGKVIGWAVTWFHESRAVNLVMTQNYAIRGIESALIQASLLRCPESVKEWNYGCGDGEGRLSHHKRRLKPTEERPYFTVHSKIFDSKVAHTVKDHMRLF